MEIVCNLDLLRTFKINHYKGNLLYTHVTHINCNIKPLVWVYNINLRCQILCVTNTLVLKKCSTAHTILTLVIVIQSGFFHVEWNKHGAFHCTCINFDTMHERFMLGYNVHWTLLSSKNPIWHSTFIIIGEVLMDL